jgi:hypothetical protein
MTGVTCPTLWLLGAAFTCTPAAGPAGKAASARPATQPSVECMPPLLAQGGVEISFMVAVDFTASNGDPRSPQSLHFIDPAGGLPQ